MSETGPLEVEFERHVAHAQAPPDVEAIHHAVRRNVTLVRGATFVVAALAIAYFSHLAGLGPGGALCVFLGMLPVLWVASWVAGMGAVMRGVKQKLEAEGARGDALTLQREKVRVRLGSGGLEVSYAGAVHQRWPWREVAVERLPGALKLSRGAQAVEVPESAFEDLSRLEAFAAAAAEHVRAEKT